MWGGALDDRATTRIDLRPSAVRVGPESIRRATNYELGNVYALTYPRDDVPPDSILRTDLLAFLPPLVEIYRDPLDAGDGTVPVARTNRRTRRLPDAAIRRACEYRAMDVVEGHYASQGWEVERVHLQYLGYDLRCIRRGTELHVEVKGSTTEALQVELTANEVAHAKAYDDAVLAVVHHIRIEIGDADIPVGVDGDLVLYRPWYVADSDLSATRIDFRMGDRWASPALLRGMSTFSPNSGGSVGRCHNLPSRAVRGLSSASHGTSGHHITFSARFATLC